MMAGYRIQNTLDDADEFLAVYKGYQVHVKREGIPEYIDEDWDGEGDAPSDYWTGPDDGYAFYIRVSYPGTTIGCLYDGWWGNADYSLEYAVEEALIGSTLITENQRKFGAPS